MIKITYHLKFCEEFLILTAFTVVIYYTFEAFDIASSLTFSSELRFAAAVRFNCGLIALISSFISNEIKDLEKLLDIRYILKLSCIISAIFYLFFQQESLECIIIIPFFIAYLSRA